jgi:hypothetical protein
MNRSWKGFIAGSFHNNHLGDWLAAWRRASQSGTVTSSRVSSGNSLSAGGMAAPNGTARNRDADRRRFFRFIMDPCGGSDRRRKDDDGQ